MSDNKETVFTHDFVRKQMQDGICKIVFEKLDGTMRNMTCTLNQNHIPAEASPIGVTNRKPRSDESLAVYDVEAEGWRSFRIDKLKKLDPQS